MAERPAREYATGDLTRALRIASWVPVVAAGALLAMRYPGLPDTIPTHFGVDGSPNDWGPKWTTLVLFGVFLAMMAGVDALSRRPRLFNYHREVTSENAQRLYREGERLMVGLQFALGFTTLGLVLLMVGEDAGNGVLWASIGFLVAATIVGVVRLVRAGRPASP